MYNSGKIIIGILIFVGLFTFAIWSPIFTGKPGPPPKLELPKDQKKCVMDTKFMTSSHMELLDQWRNSVVRDGDRVFTNPEGKTFNMSLQNTCLGCHKTKENFCDRCHNYAAVSPRCWECHIAPEYGKSKEKVARRSN
ncbi:sulfate reduction electron transfer complex DsrMKJOP subunit DsrJ [Thermodesulfobacteriota bacterium]